jgi:hypothetical protein
MATKQQMFDRANHIRIRKVQKVKSGHHVLTTGGTVALNVRPYIPPSKQEEARAMGDNYVPYPSKWGWVGDMLRGGTVRFSQDAVDIAAPPGIFEQACIYYGRDVRTQRAS